MSDAPKPCPFCGGAAAMKWEPQTYGDAAVIECEGCGIRKDARTEAAAAAEWNRRAALTAPAVPTTLGALRAMTAQCNRLKVALELACGYLTDEQAIAVAAAMPPEDAAPPAPAVPADVLRDAELGRYVAEHWTGADFRWNKDAGNTPKSVSVTIRCGHAPRHHDVRC